MYTDTISLLQTREDHLRPHRIFLYAAKHRTKTQIIIHMNIIPITGILNDKEYINYVEK